MADNDRRKFELRWGTLLLLMAVLAGVMAQYKPLVSERPSVLSEKTAPVIAAHGVDARLWQDPIAVGQRWTASTSDSSLPPGRHRKQTFPLRLSNVPCYFRGKNVKRWTIPKTFFPKASSASS